VNWLGRVRVVRGTISFLSIRLLRGMKVGLEHFRC
jgi:hypothetical protein